MVDKIKKGTETTLSTFDKLWNVLLLIAQSTAAVLGAVFCLELDNPYRSIVLGVAAILAADVVLKLYRLHGGK